MTVGSGCLYATINDAINAAQDGDTILLEGGVTFVENVDVWRSVKIQGGYNGCNSGSSEDTVIDGITGRSGFATNVTILITGGISVELSQLHLVNTTSGYLDRGGIYVGHYDSPSSLILNNVTISGCNARFAGGIWIGATGEVEGTNVTIRDNVGGDNGGGIRMMGGRLSLSNSSIYNNTSPLGGGISATDNASISLLDNVNIYGNEALTGSGLGGGISIQNRAVVVIEGTSGISENSGLKGGGVYIDNASLYLIGKDAGIMSNSAATDDGNGGGIYGTNNAYIAIENGAEVYSNSAGYTGGGIYVDLYSTLWVKMGSIYDNTSGYSGGGIYADNLALVDFEMGGYTCDTPPCMKMTGNYAEGYGGAVYASFTDVTIRQTYISGNDVNSVYSLGEFIALSHSDLQLINSMVVNNLGYRPIYADYSTINIEGSTIANNPNDGFGTAIYVYDTPITVKNSIVWGQSPFVAVQSGANPTVTCSDIQGGYTGAGNLNINPQFVNPASGNYHLASSSPVIDKCSTGPVTDFDDQPRPAVINSDATPYDMGADEYVL